MRQLAIFLSPALVLLIALAPAYGIICGNTSIGLVAVVAAVAFAGTVASLRVGAVQKLTRLLRPTLGVVLLTPLAWMVVQLAPTPLGWFSDPVWTSTSAALDMPIAGSISIDTGATLLSVAKYCAVLATAVTAAALTCDRRSAARTLYLLTAIAGVVAAAQITRDLGYSRWLYPSDGEAGSVLIAAIGIVVSCSVMIRLYGQLAGKKLIAQPRAMIAFIGTAAGLSLCTLSLLISGDGTGLFAAFFGAGVPVSMFAIRTWSLRIWGRLGVVAIAAFALVGFLVVTPIKSDADPVLALARDQFPTAELMLSNVPPLGTGAGSLQDILPIYRELNSPVASPNVTATVIAGEMGKSFLWLLIGTLAIAAAMLIRDSSRRRRDYVYAASGAGILLAFSLLVFVYSNLLGLPASLLAGVALGIAWAQARADNEDAKFARELAGPDPTTNAGRKAGGHPHQRAILLACDAFALFLMVQACWILIPSFYLSRSSPVALASAAGAAAHSENLDKAASIALVRGDLWGSSALARAALMENNGAASSTSVSIRDHLVKALIYAPYQPKIWLTFAQLADQFKWTRYNASALLKMVYYTGASEIDLVPPRTKLALRFDDATADFELRDMIKRDVELILRLRPELKPALVEAYKSATPAGRALTDSVVARLEPDLLGTLRNQ